MRVPPPGQIWDALLVLAASKRMVMLELRRPCRSTLKTHKFEELDVRSHL